VASNVKVLFRFDIIAPFICDFLFAAAALPFAMRAADIAGEGSDITSVNGADLEGIREGGTTSLSGSLG